MVDRKWPFAAPGDTLPRMIEVEGLRKEYDKLVAVDNVSFTAESGAVFGLLGPNGAGKSTTIGCISGLLQPTEGTIKLLGQPVKKARHQLGVVPQEIALYEDLSAAANVSFWASAYGMSGDAHGKAVAEALDSVGLSERAGDIVKQFSGGMKRRLNFACGVVHKPKILLLDEPTAGVDPQSRVHLLDQVRAQAATGTCVLYTTHYMEEAQELCDRLAIIDGGHVIVQGTLEELRNMMGEKDVLRLTGKFDPLKARHAAERVGSVEVVSAEADVLMLASKTASKVLPELFRELEVAGAEVRETTLSQASLESLFIKLTGKALRE